MDSYTSQDGWPHKVKCAATKFKFMMDRIRLRAQLDGSTVRIAARAMDRERGRKTPCKIHRELHEADAEVNRRDRGLQRRRDDDDDVDPDATPPRQRQRREEPQPRQQAPAPRWRQQQQGNPLQRARQLQDRPNRGQIRPQWQRRMAARQEGPAPVMWQNEGLTNGRNFHGIDSDYY